MAERTKSTLFKRDQLQKTTNDTARAIIDDEAARREAKTLRLRQMRIGDEPDKPPETAAQKRVKPKTRGRNLAFE